MNQGHKKCTEPVAPSSDFPTDRRRSDCLPESHQPWAFRTRCKAHPRGFGEPVKAPGRQLVANCVLFFSQQACCTAKPVLWIREGRKNGRTRRTRPQEFAEPGTLSSTFPTNLPLPRSAPRGASSYRRPVLGADRNLRHRTCPIKGVRRRNFSLFAGCEREPRPDREAVGFRDLRDRKLRASGLPIARG